MTVAATAAGLTVSAFVAGAGPAIASPAPADTQAPGQLIAVSHLRTLNQKDTTDELTTTGFASDTVRYGVDTYRLEYRTVDARKRPTTASGLLVLPIGGARDLRTVVFEHGTSSYRGDAPSVQQRDFVTSPALTYGAAGFAVVAPDYLGLGTGPGPHPWMDVPSETTASLDMLRAARDLLRDTGKVRGIAKGHALDREVLATGFSQGASAALGFARALSENADPWFRLRAVAPVSGAYAFRGIEIPALLGGELDAKSSTLYSGYLLVSWNRLHHLYGSASEMFRAPYDATIEQLYDGDHTGQQLMAGTPGTPEALLTQTGMDLLRRPSGRFASALRTADRMCTGWKPRVPVRLYVMRGDDQAAAANTEHCAAAFHSSGVPVTQLPRATYEGSTHLASNVLATAEIARWFSTSFRS